MRGQQKSEHSLAIVSRQLDSFIGKIKPQISTLYDVFSQCPLLLLPSIYSLNTTNQLSNSENIKHGDQYVFHHVWCCQNIQPVWDSVQSKMCLSLSHPGLPSYSDLCRWGMCLQFPLANSCCLPSKQHPARRLQGHQPSDRSDIETNQWFCTDSFWWR